MSLADLVSGDPARASVNASLNASLNPTTVFARAMLNGSELAGACFSPSGRTLFVNIFGRSTVAGDPIEGMTCAVTGPWSRGPL